MEGLEGLGSPRRDDPPGAPRKKPIKRSVKVAERFNVQAGLRPGPCFCECLTEHCGRMLLGMHSVSLYVPVCPWRCLDGWPLRSLAAMESSTVARSCDGGSRVKRARRDPSLRLARQGQREQPSKETVTQ